MKAVDVSCWKSPTGLILLTEGQKMHRFCVCAGQTVSILVEQERSWVWVGVRGGGGQASSFSATVFSCALFIYLGRCVHPPCRVCYLFSLWVRAPIQSTLTHIHTLVGTYIAYGDACDPPPPPPPARPLPAARTHIVSHCLPLSHPLWMAPGVLSFLSGFLALSLPPAACLNPSYLSMNLPISCVSMYWSPYLPIFSPSLYLKLVPPGEGRKRKEAVLTRVQEPETNWMHFITNKPGCFRRRTIREENENTQELRGLFHCIKASYIISASQIQMH